jgi:hypothetical protein
MMKQWSDCAKFIKCSLNLNDFNLNNLMNIVEEEGLWGGKSSAMRTSFPSTTVEKDMPKLYNSIHHITDHQN